MSFAISEDFIATENARHQAALAEDYEALGRQLARRGISIEAMTERVHVGGAPFLGICVGMQLMSTRGLAMLYGLQGAQAQGK